MPSDQDDNTRTHITLSKGTSVSHYTIIDKIGAGGMGEVYLAEDTKLHRKVALKFLPSRFAVDADFRARFVREAEAMAKLNHPNIITIYEVSEHHDQPFFAMELVEGQSLRALSKSKELSLDRIIELAIQVCDGLSAAHDKKVIHRDIKPSNIVIDSYGRPKILDFGLAAIQGGEHITKTGSTLGTVRYMSPEQVKGQKVDHRSDLFSLGVVLYELISGRTPFEKDNEAATLKAITQDNAEPLSRYKSDIPEELQRTISKLLERDPSLRYQHADGVISDLKRLITPTQSFMAVTQSNQKSRFKKWILSGTSLAIIISLVLILKPWQFRIESTDEAVAAENRLAIMYFDNIVDPADEKRLGEIVANLLISKLSNSDGIKVVSSQRLYDILKLLGHEGEKQINRDVASQIAKEAKARWMLTGSILRIEPTFVITVQLIEVATGNILSSPEITGETGEDIFALAVKINSEIAERLLLPKATDTEKQNKPELHYTNSAEAFKYYLEGSDFFLRFKRIEAKNSYKKAIELDSNFTMAYFKASFMSDIKKNIDKAVELIDRVNKKEQLLIRAEREYIYQNYDEAIKIFEQIIDQYPEEKGAYMSLGFIYIGFEKRNLPKAIELFEKTIEIDPLFKRSYNVLAYTYEKIGENGKSIWAINKYIELVPNEPNPYNSRGALFGFQGEHQKALESYSNALEIDPNFIGSYLGMVKNNFALGNYVEAEKWLDKIVSYDDKSVRSLGRFIRARVSLNRGKIKESLDRVNLAIEMHRIEMKEEIERPGIKNLKRAEIFVGVAQLTGELNWFDSARTIIDKLINEYDADTSLTGYYRFDLYFWKIQMENGLGNSDSVDTYISNFSNSPTGQTSFGKRLSGHLRVAKAFSEDDFETAIRIEDPAIKFEKHSQILGRIGVSYFKAKKIGRAVEVLEEATTRIDYRTGENPVRDVWSQFYLAKAYEASGWKDKAIAQYEKFLHLMEDADDGILVHIEAKENLAKLKAAIQVK